MNPDDLKPAWKVESSQTRLTTDPERLIEDLRLKQECFRSAIFWRDVREVGVCLLLVPLWIYLGIRNALPWSWYLAVPAMLWIAGFMLVDRLRHNRRQSGPGEPLRQGVESSLAQVDHQIWLLRNVLWWYLLPIALAMLAFFAQVTWQERSGGWLAALAALFVIIIEATVLAGVYWVNQHAVRAVLEPRRLELETMLRSLEDEPSGAS